MGFFDASSLPGIGTTATTAEATFLWGRHEQCYFKSVVIDSTATDLNNSAVATTQLRTGLLLGQKTSGGKCLGYSPVATDGTEVVVGVLPIGVNMLSNTTGAVSDRLVAIVVGGPVKGSQLIKNVNGSPTIDPLARATMKNRFIFDDDLSGNPYPWKRVIDKSADYTVTIADNGTLFTASGAVTFTLPSLLDASSNPQCKGCHYKFYQTADSNMVIDGYSTDALIALANASVATITFSTSSEKIGACVEIETNAAGTKWLATISNKATATLA